MSVYYFDLLPDHNVPKDGEKGEDGRECAFAVYHQKGHVVDLETVGEISYPSPAIVSVGDNNDLVAPVNKLG